MATKKEVDPLKNQLEESRGKLETAESNLEKAKAVLHSMEGKIRDLSDRLQNKRFIRETKAEELAAALKGVEESAALEATEELHKLDREILALGDLHAASLEAKRKAEGELRKALQKVDGAIHEFWYLVSKIEAARVAGNEQLLKAWIASQLARTVMSYGDFLKRAFGSYNVDELGALKEELFKTYGRREG
ncbi:MAG: hypothetical protein FJ115_10325 [Deltaproteobacteria bacterium]|nr:hypothetical protein [Deltaproteobacteria bacterium]